MSSRWSNTKSTDASLRSAPVRVPASVAVQYRSTAGGSGASDTTRSERGVERFRPRAVLERLLEGVVEEGAEVVVALA